MLSVLSDLAKAEDITLANLIESVFQGLVVRTDQWSFVESSRAIDYSGQETGKGMVNLTLTTW
jgi:hypothetical protein